MQPEGLWIFGLILMGIGGFLIAGYFSRKKKVEVIESTQTSTVDFLKSLSKSMSEGVGEGTLSYMTEIKGRIICDQPLVSELGGSKCVYYSMRIERQYEETYYTTDNQGRRIRQTRTVNETVASNQRSVPFYVQDPTGQIKVEASGAEFIAEKILSRFEPASGRSGASLRIGGFSITVPTDVGDRRTIGYTFEEEAIPVGRDVYILGEASDRDGEVSIRHPLDKEKKFIVSIKSEEELLGSMRTEMTWMKVGGILCEVVGIGLIIANFFKVK